MLPASVSATTAGAATPPGNDIGITATQIRIGVLADVNTPVNPGLFQQSVNGVKAWAANINAHGGLAGRKIAVDFYDTQLNPNLSRNAVIQACSKDFALVGTDALLLTDFADVDGCKNAQGQAIGIPNLAGITFGSKAQCDAVTYAVQGTDPTFCATLNQTPQTYTLQEGDARYYVSKFKGLHGIWVYNTDVPQARAVQLPSYTVASNLGIKKDAEGFYGSSGEAPQTALTPIVSVIKANNSTFASDGSTPPNYILLRREAQLQGVSGVKVWSCAAGCYTPYFIPQGGTAVNGTYQILSTLPFYSESNFNPALASLGRYLPGGIGKMDSNGMSSYIEALLFQDAVTKAVANGGTLSRQSLFKVLKTQEHSFTAQGVVGPTDVSNHAVSPCMVMAQVANGKWQRVYPSKPGTFDCSSKNVIVAKIDAASL